MPIVRIELLQGRAPTVKKELIFPVTDAVVSPFGVDPEYVGVLPYRLLPDHWAVGIQTKAV